MRYYFHIFNDTITHDEEGSELPDDSAAIELARREARNLASESIKEHAHLVLHHKIVVVDAAEREIGSVAFGDVISIRE